ncbi:CDP-glucose 4,6-dehydratase [Thiohalocapsa halophila]|uniref:CDP-glucose 4,6-dehydratase n=1 Tax=Thiohalocapsa halophila TaxID=69359 RepID=A0ABS1CJA5_9GAMM|nr:CDP-glucose 4,6-dehydratase [Thiohalocapsa halophila]MBK1631887.1 CDP-glucose 4,6-dehydratase [Thiohalocapsa halophila]
MEPVAARADPAPSFWAGRRVLVTGHTGFKGGWLAIWLHRMGARVTGFSLAPVSQPNLYHLAGVGELTASHLADVRDAQALQGIVAEADPEVVFHLAAQPLVRASYRDPLGTFASNVQGTASLLDALRPLSALRAVVAITTDKVYRNLEQAFPYRETDALGGHDPYSASKAAAEMVIASYRDAFLAGQGVAVASARAGNVIGGGDWSEDRLIPDAVRAWEGQQSLDVRRPMAIRPWQHVLEPLCAYLVLAERLWDSPKAFAGAYNFGPQTHEAATVREVITLARESYGKGDVNWGDGSDGPHEAGWLALEVAKARHRLGIAPRWSLGTSVERTMRWYRRQAQGESAAALCAEDLDAYLGVQPT